MKRLMLGLALAGPLGAADCPALLAQLERQRDEPAVALATYRQADEELCFSSPSMADSQRRALLARWEERLFRQIFAGEAIDMENPQSRRLLAAQAEIRQGAQFVNGSEDWPMLLLLALLDVNTQHKDFKSEEMQQRLDSVIAGYLRDAEADRLPAHIPERLGEFLLILRQTQLLLIQEEQYQRLKHKRGGGDSELTRLALLLMKNKRGGVLSSSEEQPAGLINRTPIRFKYDSVELNSQGEAEYRENLPIMRANSTERIFLVGHTDTSGTAEYNCWLSQCRVEALRNRLVADGVPAEQISVDWAGENIPLDFGIAQAFLRDIAVESKHGEAARRRVEYETNGDLLRQKYEGRLCPRTPAPEGRQCPH